MTQEAQLLTWWHSLREDDLGIPRCLHSLLPTIKRQYSCRPSAKDTDLWYQIIWAGDSPESSPYHANSISYSHWAGTQTHKKCENKEPSFAWDCFAKHIRLQLTAVPQQILGLSGWSSFQGICCYPTMCRHPAVSQWCMPDKPISETQIIFGA